VDGLKMPPALRQVDMIHETSAGLTKTIINTGVSNRGLR
jgi:hypothetical protein